MAAPVLQLRVAITAEDYESILAFYRDGLGLDPAADWSDEHGHGVMFAMGSGTLEVFDEPYAANVDQIEVGQRVSAHIRFALQVPDLDAAIRRLKANGATVVHEPITTTWGDRNARVRAPDGLQVTLFQILDKG